MKLKIILEIQMEFLYVIRIQELTFLTKFQLFKFIYQKEKAHNFL